MWLVFSNIYKQWYLSSLIATTGFQKRQDTFKTCYKRMKLRQTHYKTHNTFSIRSPRYVSILEVVYTFSASSNSGTQTVFSLVPNIYKCYLIIPMIALGILYISLVTILTGLSKPSLKRLQKRKLSGDNSRNLERQFTFPPLLVQAVVLPGSNTIWYQIAWDVKLRLPKSNWFLTSAAAYEWKI